MKNKVIITIIVILVVASFSIWFFNIKKVTTYEECVNAGWLIRSRGIYDGFNLFGTKYECVLWGGKSFIKQEKQPEVQEGQVEHTIDGIPFYSDFYYPLTPQGKSCVSRVLGYKKLDEINGGLPSAHLTQKEIVALKNCVEKNK